MILGIRRLSPISPCVCHLQDALHKTGFINFESGLLDRFAVDQRENYAVAHYKNVMLVQLRLFEIVFQILFGGVDQQLSSSSLKIVKIIIRVVVILIVTYIIHDIFNVHVSLGTDDEKRNFESFAVLDDGNVDLSKTL